MATEESIFVLIEEERTEDIEDMIDQERVDINAVDEVSGNVASASQVKLTGFIHDLITPYTHGFRIHIAHRLSFCLPTRIPQDGYTPLILATSMGLHDIAEVLLDAKGDIDYVAEARHAGVIDVGTSARGLESELCIVFKARVCATGWCISTVLRGTRGPLGRCGTTD